ncbi:TPA: hypothetical protein OL464_003720 [Clostridioides difficile]|nr:hypothetical protein [Clostridioides difficile]
MEEEKQQDIKKEEEQQSSNTVDFSSLESKLDALLKLNEKIFNADEKERQQIQKEKEEQQKKIIEEEKNQQKIDEEQKQNNTKKLRQSELDNTEQQKYQDTIVKNLDTIVTNQSELILLSKINFVGFGIISALLLVLIVSVTLFKKNL